MNRWMKWIIATICIVALLLGLRMLIEPYESHIFLGESGEARRNPYLAAERFLDAQKVNVISNNNAIDFDTIPPVDTIIFARVDAMLVSQMQIDMAVDWIHAGGHMIVGAGAEIEGKSSLLQAFDVTPEEALHNDLSFIAPHLRKQEINRQFEQQEEEDKKSEKGDAEEIEKSQLQEISAKLNRDIGYEFFPLEVEDLNDRMYMAVLDNIVLSHPEINGDGESNYDDYELSTWKSDEQGVRVLQFDYGEGMITVLSSANLWKNDYIGLADHAFFLTYLIAEDSNLHLFYNIESASIVALLYRYFPELLWCLAAALFFWLWYRAVRIHSMRTLVEGQRRIFAEHLASSAEFLIKNEQFTTLLKPLEDEIAQHMRPHCANYSELEPQAQAEVLQHKTKLAQSSIRQWITFTKRIASKEDLFAALQLGQTIRKSL